MPADTETPPVGSRKLVVVCGSGRSGTSTFVGILRELGAWVPQPEVEADSTNPKGFGEPTWAVDLHRGLLEQIPVHPSDARPQAWTETAKVSARGPLRQRVADWLEEQFAQADEVVVKDPRLVWFLGLWKAAAIRAGAEPVFVTMLRAPAEVVKSKQTHYRQRSGDAHGIAGWLNLMLAAERATRGSTRVFVRYADLIQDWTTVIHPLGDRLDLHTVRTAGPTKMRRVHGFIDPTLHRHQPTLDDLDLPAPLRDLGDRAWQLLDRLAGGEDTAEVHAALDALQAEYAAYYAECEAVAFSTVWAQGRRPARGRAVAAPQDAGSPAADSPAAASPAVTERIRSATPHWLRAAVPAGVRQKVRARLDGNRRTGLTR